MKKLIAGLLAGCFLLLTACGAQPAMRAGSSMPESAAVNPEQQAAENSAADETTAAETATQETSAQETSAQETSAQETSAPELLSDEVEAVGQDVSEENTFTIYEDEDYQLQLMVVQAFDTCATEYLVRFTNHADCKTYANITAITLNDSIAGVDGVYLTGQPGTVTEGTMDEVSSKLMYAEESTLQSISGSFEIKTDTDDGIEVAAEDQFTLELPEDFQPQLLCEPCMDARAEAQILVDNENVRISLLGAGKYHDASTTYSNSFSGIISVVNKNDYEIPFQITGCKINGISLSVISESGETLQPQATGNLSFRVEADDLAAVGVASIVSVSLTVATSKTELSSYFDNVIVGGTQYPVVLSQAGSEEKNTTYQPVAEDLVYEQNDIRIYARGHEISFTGYYLWNLWVENDRDSGISFGCGDDTLVDGEAPGSSHIYTVDQIGAHAVGPCTITLFDDYGIFQGKFPSLALQLLIKSEGGDRLIDTVDNIAFEEAEFQLLEDTGDVQIWYTGHTYHSGFGHCFEYWMINACSQSDTAVEISAEVLSPDGLYVNEITLESKECINQILFWGSMEAGEEVPEVSFRMIVTDPETDEILYAGDSITLSPSI